jgi:uncharacterized protein with PIN domain
MDKPYWMQRRDMKLGGASPAGKSAVKKQAEKATKVVKKDLSAWFEEQLSAAPERCEECGAKLAESMGINPRTIVCHIVPKNKNFGVPEVATHEDNRFYGCYKCHQVYDTGGEKAAAMKILPLLKSRLSNFIHLIPADKLRRVPKFLQ